MSSDEAKVHIISKGDLNQHLVTSASQSSLPPLQDGRVRARTALISLSSNNWSYALMGSVRNWWDTYPVPDTLSKPYNDSDQYGIVPAWGYGEVLESQISGIDVGTLIWGFWPTSDLAVDLTLVRADIEGHWIEVSEGRKDLMNVYQRYSVPAPTERLASLDRTRIEEMAWEAALIVWEAGHLLNDAVFGSPPIHPLGIGDWTEDDADLSYAVVISLSGAGKTARSFHHGLINHRSEKQNPLGLLAITSVQTGNLISHANFPTSTILYGALTHDDTLGWIAQKNPEKIVIVDFGGRGDSLQKLLQALEERFGNIKTVIIGVGGNVASATPQDLGQWAQKNMSFKNRVQMNMSDIRDAAIDRSGAKAYFKGLNEAWRSFVKSASIGDLKLEIGEGVADDQGFEGGWTRLCEGKVGGNVALVYKF